MFQNKTMLITGSSRGIGAAIARLAHDRGARVILHGKTESDELKKIAHEISADYVVFDVSDEQAANQAIQKIGDIDILVNNAGVNFSKTFTELSVDDFRSIFEVNVMGTVIVSKAVIPGMFKQGHGKIINIASVKGLLHTAAKPAYAASKAAIMRMTSSMAQEFAPHISVNAVAPGFTETEMTEQSLSPQIQQQIDTIPMGRMATPDEIAETVLFLASDAANYTTGQTLVVDGGWSII